MNNRFMDQERIDFLANKVSASEKTARLPAWPRSEKDLPVVELEVEWVRFSTLNHRTKAEQRREIHDTGRPDLFTADPLGPTAQTAQNKILCNQTAFLALKTDLAERGQQENAIVTAEGVLINGNRRVSAMRNLLSDDKNLSCRYVRCLVLPTDANGSEMVQLETELQVAQDFKQEYSWVNQALLIEELYESYGRDFGSVAKLMHRKVKEVRDDHAKIQQLNQLVDLSQGQRLHADFEPNESAFNELAQHIRNKNEGEKEAVRSVYFLGTLASVNYRALRHLRRADADEFVDDELRGDEQLSEIVSLAEANTKVESRGDELLDEALGDAGDVTLTRTMLEFVAGLDYDSPVQLPSGNDVEVADVFAQIGRAITKASEEAEEDNRDVNAAGAPLMRLDRALVQLRRAHDSLAAARATPGWDEARFMAKLAAVEACVAGLKDEA